MSPLLVEILNLLGFVAFCGFCYWLGRSRCLDSLKQARAAIERVREVAHGYDGAEKDRESPDLIYNLGRLDMAAQVLQYGLREHLDHPITPERMSR